MSSSSSPSSPLVVIAGAGPAGMTLAYLLASNGVRVRVLERHKDFEREFRGELVQPSSVSALRSLGVLDVLEQRGLAIGNVQRRLLVGHTREVMSALRTRGEQGMLVSQPALLQLLHEACAQLASGAGAGADADLYRLDFGTAVTEAERDASGRVVALKARNDDGDVRVEGDVFVCTSGRHCTLRRTPGVEVESFEQPADVLWLRFDLSDEPALLPKGVDVHMLGNGVVVVVFPVSRHRLQVAYSAPGDMAALRRDPAELKRKLIPSLPPSLRDVVSRKLDEKTEWQILRVGVDRLKKWSVPGLLFIGDAAHTMSPSGGQGLNVAIRDAIVTANEIIDDVKAGRAIDQATFDRIERARRAEVEAVQSQQIRAGKAVLKPVIVQHLMMTMISAIMALVFKAGADKGSVVDVKHPVPIAR